MAMFADMVTAALDRNTVHMYHLSVDINE